MSSTVRTVPPTPATPIRSYVNSINATPSRSRLTAAPSTPSTKSDLPKHLARLLNIYYSLEQSMIATLHRLTPDSDNGRFPAVLNHLGIAECGMGSMQMDADDLRRLCWIWEWDPDAEHEMSIQKEGLVPFPHTTRTGVHSDTTMRLVNSAEEEGDEDGYFFLHKHAHFKGKAQGDNYGSESETSEDWIRRGSGFIITPTLHVRKNAATGTFKSEPAYGIGFEVDCAHEDVTGGRVGGTSALERWAAARETRIGTFKAKLETWVKVSLMGIYVSPRR